MNAEDTRELFPWRPTLQDVPAARIGTASARPALRAMPYLPRTILVFTNKVKERPSIALRPINARQSGRGIPRRGRTVSNSVGSTDHEIDLGQVELRDHFGSWISRLRKDSDCRICASDPS
jgi:hypothetical protein